MQIGAQAATAHAAACGRPPSWRAQPLLLLPPPAHQLHRGGPTLSSVVCCDSISSSSSGVLEQPVFAAAEELLWEPEVLAPLDSTGYERAFNDYASATQVYEELERMQVRACPCKPPLPSLPPPATHAHTHARMRAHPSPSPSAHPPTPRHTHRASSCPTPR